MSGRHGRRRQLAHPVDPRRCAFESGNNQRLANSHGERFCHCAQRIGSMRNFPAASPPCGSGNTVQGHTGRAPSERPGVSSRPFSGDGPNVKTWTVLASENQSYRPGSASVTCKGRLAASIDGPPLIRADSANLLAVRSHPTVKGARVASCQPTSQKRDAGHPQRRPRL